MPTIVGFSGKIASGKTSTSRAFMSLIDDGDGHYRHAFGDALKEEVDTIIALASRHPDAQEAINNHQSFFRNIPHSVIQEVMDILRQEVQKNPAVTATSTSKSAATRTAMQKWGQARREEDAHYWSNALRDKINSLPEKCQVCVDDIRYPNEAQLIKDMGGIIIRLDVSSEEQERRVISRDGHLRALGNREHSSETSLDDWDGFTLRVSPLKSHYDENDVALHILEQLIQEGVF